MTVSEIRLSYLSPGISAVNMPEPAPVHQGFESLSRRIGQPLHLRSTKLDESPNFEWTCRVLRATCDELVLYQAAGTPMWIWHQLWRPDCEARVFFWRGRWFNVIEKHGPNGEVQEFYCNIITPARLAGDQLRWEDLDLDGSVARNGSYCVRDEDEWMHTCKRLDVAPEITLGAPRRGRAGVDGGAAPFDALTPAP